jgi:hypothetical protein
MVLQGTNMAPDVLAQSPAGCPLCTHPYPGPTTRPSSHPRRRMQAAARPQPPAKVRLQHCRDQRQGAVPLAAPLQGTKGEGPCQPAGHRAAPPWQGSQAGVAGCQQAGGLWQGRRGQEVGQECLRIFV